MERDVSHFEAMPRFEQYPGSGQGEPWRRSVKVKLFAVAFGFVFLVGMVWIALQPVIYRSSATVLMSAPEAIDAQVSEANLQGVAIQRTILLGQEITRLVQNELAATGGVNLEPEHLRELLRVESLPDTNLIEMVAQGEAGEELPSLVAAWIEVYAGVRAANIVRSKEQTVKLVQDELDGLAIRIHQSRLALEQYREDNNIVSVKREENEVLARLAGLNKALNNAVEEEVKAKVHLESLHESISRGQVVVPEGDKRSLQSLEGELEQLRTEMLDLKKRYTMEYIYKQPALRAIPQRIEELEVEVASQISQGQAEELARAEQSYFAARRAVVELQQKLDEHRQDVARFNRIYATHEALAEDLAGLETLNRETQARLAKMEVRQVEKYPQITVIEPPGSSRRIGPDYLLLLGATLAAALGCGVLAVWLYRFLGHEQAAPAYVTLSGVHLYPEEVSGELAYSGKPEDRLAVSETQRLSSGKDDES